jgi:hypothetical protein
VLPLLGTQYRQRWHEHLEIAGMASFNLMLVTPQRLTWWAYDGETLAEHELTPGVHHLTPTGRVADTAWAGRPLDDTAGLDGELDALWGRWRAEVTGTPPSADQGAMIVRRELDGDVYQTVFGQFIAARPGELRIDHARLPYREQPWTSRRWSASDGRLSV